MAALAPTTTDELCDAIANAARLGTPLEIRGGSSKSKMGADRGASILDMCGFSGIIDYDPSELVLTVRAGTRLAEVERLVASENQMLAFEPWDHGPVFGRETGQATIGGIVAAGVSGSNRLTMGAVRDHLLGFEAVSGRAEHFVAGARVVKNVTGFDLSKLIAGSWGRLAAVTVLTLKVLPRPRSEATMVIENLEPAQALAAMAKAMCSHAEISATAHVPARSDGSVSLTAFRLSGFEPSVAARCRLLPDILRDHGSTVKYDECDAEALWKNVRHAAAIDNGRALWRINVPPSQASKVVARMVGHGADWMFDWAGGLVWLGFDGDPTIVRRAAEQAGGNAMLVRGNEALRAKLPFQHPRSAGVAALEERIRRSFDPSQVFETGRFLDHSNAD